MEEYIIKSEINNKSNNNIKIDFFEEILIKKENIDYTINLGIKQNNKELIIRIISNKYNNLFYYQQSYTIKEIQKLSKAFSLYETIKDIITFLKKLNYEIDEEKDNFIIIKFKIYFPDGKNELIKLNLEKNFQDKTHIIKYFLETVKSFEAKMKNSEEKFKNEIFLLKEENKKYQKEIVNLKDTINKYKKEIKKGNNKFIYIISAIIFLIFLLFNYKIKSLIKTINNNIINAKEENNKINSIKINSITEITPETPIKIKINKNINNNFDSKILTSINDIYFILEYFRQNDELLLTSDGIKLLYRSSIDGDSSKTCHLLCYNKENILIIIQTIDNYIFGGYSKIGFNNNTANFENKIDNKTFLFSVNLTKIYPAFKTKRVIGHFNETRAFCFTGSLYLYDNFMNRNNYISNSIKKYFNGLNDDYEMNGYKYYFKIKELEVFQLLLNY